MENINIQKYQDLISSWLEVLVYFETTKINQIIRLYLTGLLKRKELINTLEPILFYCINKMNNEQKEKLRCCFLETLLTIPNNKNILQSDLRAETLNFILKK
jgi:DNA repair protein RadC